MLWIKNNCTSIFLIKFSVCEDNFVFCFIIDKYQLYVPKIWQQKQCWIVKIRFLFLAMKRMIWYIAVNFLHIIANTIQ